MLFSSFDAAQLYSQNILGRALSFDPSNIDTPNPASPVPSCSNVVQWLRFLDAKTADRDAPKIDLEKDLSKEDSRSYLASKKNAEQTNDFDAHNTLCAGLIQKYKAEQTTAEVKAKKTLSYLAKIQENILEVSYHLGNLPAFLADFRTLVARISQSTSYENRPPVDKLVSEVQRTLKKLIEGLFKNRSMDALRLTAQDAQVFLDFVRDVLLASASTNKLLAPWPTEFSAVVNEEDFKKVFATVINELSTHTSKIANAAAKYGCVLPQKPDVSRFVNSTIMAPLLSGTANGGLLKDRSWLIQVLPFCFEFEDGTRLSIIDLLTAPESREVLTRQGVTSFDDIPVVQTLTPAPFNGHFVSSVRVKVSDTCSKSIKLVPSNVMIKIMSQLSHKYRYQALLEQSDVLFQKLIAEAEKTEVEGLVFSDTEKEKLLQVWTKGYPTYCATRHANKEAATTLLNALYEVLPKEKRALISEKVFDDSLRTGRYNKATSVPSGSQPQNMGSVYNDYHALYGNRGLPRFKSYKPFSTPKKSNKYELNSVDNHLAKEVAIRSRSLRKRPEATTAKLTEKYGLPHGWAASRINPNPEAYIDGRVKAYCDAVCSAIAPIRKMSEDERRELEAEGLSALKMYALNLRLLNDAALMEIAKKGTALLDSINQSFHSTFIDSVVSQLKELQQCSKKV